MTKSDRTSLEGARDVLRSVKRYGLAVFPIDCETKHPLLGDYLRRATRSPARIRKMHSYWTNKLGHPPGWGVAPALSGIVPVDVDVKEGKPGQRYFDWFDLAYGWPETLRSQSPSGGFHLWYRGPG
jgi:hypothetical protein